MFKGSNMIFSELVTYLLSLFNKQTGLCSLPPFSIIRGIGS